MLIIIKNPLSENTTKEVQVNPGDHVAFAVWELGGNGVEAKMMSGIFRESDDDSIKVDNVFLLTGDYVIQQLGQNTPIEIEVALVSVDQADLIIGPETVFVFKVDELAEIEVIVPKSEVIQETTLRKAIREEIVTYLEQKKCKLNTEQIEETVEYILHDDYLWEKFNQSMAFCIDEILVNRPTVEVVEITTEQGIEIIQTRTPLGLFYLKNDNGMWVGIDNRGGDAWAEDFREKSLCIDWLHDVDSRRNQLND